MPSLQELEAELAQLMGGAGQASSPAIQPTQAAAPMDEETRVRATMEMEKQLGTYLKSQLDRDGNLRPKWAQGQTEESALSESAVDPEERLKLSFLGSRERIAKKLQESGQFEEVKMNKLDQLVVKKDGLWHQYDPDASAWDTTKALISGGVAKVIGQDLTQAEREAWSDMADVAPELALTAAMTGIGAAAGAGLMGAGAAAAATGKAALGAQMAFAGASGVASKGVSTVLGRALDAYTPEPEELLSDLLLEGALTAAGVPIAAGVKWVGGRAKDSLVMGMKRLGDSKIGSQLGKKFLAMSGNTTDDIVEVAVRNADTVDSHFKRLIGLTDDEAGAKLITEQSDEVAGMVDGLLKTEQAFRDKARNTFVASIPDNITFKPTEITNDFLIGLKDSGLVTVMDKATGAEFTQEAFEAKLRTLGPKLWDEVIVEPTSSIDRILARANPAKAEALLGMTDTDANLIKEQVGSLLRLTQGGELKGREGARTLLGRIESTRRALGGSWRGSLSETSKPIGKQLYEGFEAAINNGLNNKFSPQDGIKRTVFKPWEDYVGKIASLNDMEGPGLILKTIRDSGGSMMDRKKFATQLARDIAKPGQRVGAGLKNSGIENALDFFDKEGFGTMAGAMRSKLEQVKVLEAVRAFSPRITRQAAAKAQIAMASAPAAAATMGGFRDPNIAGALAFPLALATNAAMSSSRLTFQIMRNGQHFLNTPKPQVKGAAKFLLNTLNATKVMGRKATQKVLSNEAVVRAIEAQLAGRLAGEIVD